LDSSSRTQFAAGLRPGLDSGILEPAAATRQVRLDPGWSWLYGGSRQTQPSEASVIPAAGCLDSGQRRSFEPQAPPA